MPSVTDSAPPRTGLSRPWDEQNWDLIVLRMLASGLVDWSARAHDDAGLSPPYPVSIQRGLDRLTAMSITLGTRAPRSAMDLARWAHQPFGDWPTQLNIEGVDPDETLLRNGQPTQACLEWAVLSGDVEAEVRERDLLHAVLQNCREHDNPDLYVRFRRLLVEQPAMSERDFALMLAMPELTPLATQLQAAYRPAPAEALLDGEAVICDGCGHLWTADSTGTRRCQEWDCPNPAQERKRLPEREGVLWLPRELRMFISGPGRAELRIADTLSRKGLDVRLWPDYDACDVFPVQAPFAADVKAWSNPVRLAWRLNDRPFQPPAEAQKGFIVIAAEQTVGRPDYLRTVRHHCTWLKSTSRVEVTTERAYIRRVAQRAKGATR